MNKKQTALLGVAVAAITLAAAGCSSSPKATGDAAEGECHGVNACKGKGDCGGPGYSCAGNNACKGQGWVKLAKNDCLAKGGKFKPN